MVTLTSGDTSLSIGLYTIVVIAVALVNPGLAILLLLLPVLFILALVLTVGLASIAS